MEAKSSAGLEGSVPPTAVARPAADASTLCPVPEPLRKSDGIDAKDAARTPSPGESSQNVANMTPTAHRPIELPPGLTLSTLKARLNGSKVKGQYLTPDEMHFFTKSWRPYRSLGEC